MNVKKILALMLCAMMLLSLAACGAKDNDKQADMSGDSSAMTGEPKTAEEALALHKELLEREDLSASQVAEQVGILDVSYFIRLFKRETGMTPGEYQAMAKEK